MSALALHSGDGSRESARWGVSFVVVCALHLGVAAAFLHSRVAFVPPGTPPDAVLIDLEPSPKFVEPVPAPAPPPPPEPEIRKEEPPPPPPPIKDAVTLSKPPPPKPAPPRPERVAEQPKKLEPVAPAVPATVMHPPKPSKEVASTPSNTLPTWEAQVMARLDRVKRYPRRAQLRHQEGVVYLRFTLDRHGNVLRYELARSSGIDTLDQDTLTLIDRAKPFPPMPAELGRESMELVVPIRYILR